MPLPSYTGFDAGTFYITGTPSKRIVEIATERGWLRFPSLAHRNHALKDGPTPESAFDSLPEDEPTP